MYLVVPNVLKIKMKPKTSLLEGMIKKMTDPHLFSDNMTSCK